MAPPAHQGSLFWSQETGPEEDAERGGQYTRGQGPRAGMKQGVAPKK